MAEAQPAFRRHPFRFFDDPDAAANAVVTHLEGLRGQFDRLTRNTDDARITATDLVAVSMLGLPVPAEAAAWMLGEEGQWLTTEILADIDPDLDLQHANPRCILRAADLFQLLRANTSSLEPSPDTAAVGQATATKILAAKRPRLAPLDDREIRSALKYPKDTLWFRRWQSILDDEALLDAISATRAAAAERAPEADALSDLRILDVVVRRRAHKRKRHAD